MPAPPGWTRVKTASEAINLLETEEVSEMSLDHDLGPPESGTGYDVAVYLEERAYHGTILCGKIYVHSQNPVGRQKILAAIEKVNKA